MKQKFNLGEEVFFLWNNKVLSRRVKRIIHGCDQIWGVDPDIIDEYYLYNIDDRNIDCDFSEDSLFKTKQELLDSL